MSLCSSRTGQAALQVLPSLSDKRGYRIKDDILNFALPENALQTISGPTSNLKIFTDANDSESVESGISISNNYNNKKPFLGIALRRNRSTSSILESGDGRLQGVPKGSKTSSEGIVAWKIDKMGKLQARRLTFSDDRRRILLTRMHKSLRGFFKAATGIGRNRTEALDLSLVDSVQIGLRTARLRRASISAFDDSEADQGSDLDHSNTFPKLNTISIVYESPGSLQSLDLVIPDSYHFRQVAHVLKGLVALHRLEQLSKTPTLQRLEYYCLQLNKPIQTTESKEGMVSHSDFIILSERMDLYHVVGKHRLSALFKDACNHLNRKNEYLSLSEADALLEKAHSLQNLAEIDTLEQLWKKLVETDPVQLVGLNGTDLASSLSYELNVMEEPDMEESISTVAFFSFLRTEQKELSQTLDDATAMVNALNSLQTLRSQNGGLPESIAKRAIAPDDRLTKSRFMDFITSDFNDLLQPVSKMDMSRPLSHYFIATSHCSFLSAPTLQSSSSLWDRSGQDYSVPSKPEVESIYVALYRGVRCLEFTVWDGFNGTDPVVCLTEDDRSDSIRFADCLDAVVYFLQQHPQTFPILLKIENHCSNSVQTVLANNIRGVLGAPGYLFEPAFDLHDSMFVLPSPEEARGKVIIMGKRARKASKEFGVLAKVINDDYDATNDRFDIAESPSLVKYFDEEEDLDQHKGAVIGFNAEGPIHSSDVQTIARSPKAMCDETELERIVAQREAEKTFARAVDLENRAARKEEEALAISRKGEVASRLARRRTSRVRDTSPEYNAQEEKNTKDEEGIEIHEVLSNIVETSQEEYAVVSHEAMEAVQRLLVRKKEFEDAEAGLRQAREDLQKAKDHMNRALEESQKARLKATTNLEHSQAANARLEKVRDLLENSEETSASAETVVVTALTEAKISEKRAAEAEARASRAFATATKDRARSEEETRKEEELENSLTALLQVCKNAQQKAKDSRERYEQVDAVLKRVSSVPDKRVPKSAEQEILMQKLGQISNEIKSAEIEKMNLQKEVDEVSTKLKAQTELAAKMRKIADRSFHMAEELAEHAEEEREAANLRQVARERAEANVQDRGTLKRSLQTQFQEAQRAATEAAALAEESRKKADRLEKELKSAQDLNRLAQAVEDREWARNQAKLLYDFALSEKQDKDAQMLKQRKLVEVSDEVRHNARFEISREEDRVKSRKEAASVSDEAALLRREATEARRLAEAAAESLKEKSKAARRALEYMDKMSLVANIPHDLSVQTLLHSLRFFNWEKSLSLSNAHYHSIAYSTLSKLIERETQSNTRGARKFTETHLCRIYPSQTDVRRKRMSNYDPVFAWILGCQLVSVNYNSPGEHLLVAEGMFRKNASCGYVLKPPRLFGPMVEDSIHHDKWMVKILGAYHLPKHSVSSRRQPIQPIVRLTVHTGEVGSLPFKFETTQSYRQGTDPILYTGDNTCSVDVANPWAAVATFTVWDTSEQCYIAGAAIPVSCFREGYRSVALFDAYHSRTGATKFSSLLIHVSKEK